MAEMDSDAAIFKGLYRRAVEGKKKKEMQESAWRSLTLFSLMDW